MKLQYAILLLSVFEFYLRSVESVQVKSANASIPLIVITWDYHDATEKAFHALYNQKKTAIDAIEIACASCENARCRKTVGYGGSPDESGETTLDAMIMDGAKMDVGAVGGLRNIKSAISVARKVLENTEHSLLGGSLATKFAIQMGFKTESLQTDESKTMWLDWKTNNCQPNFWKNVIPDPKASCGPYTPRSAAENTPPSKSGIANEDNHDTIGVIAIDSQGNIAAGTSTNGARNKIPGRIGDSPIPGAGAYADQRVGAAAGTGDGDIMMRFLPSFLAVEEMRRGATPAAAAAVAIHRIAEHYPDFFGGVIALNKEGHYGAACNGMARFPFYVANPSLDNVTLVHIPCAKPTYCVINSR